MALYVRLMCNYYTHRKTAMLRSLIGTDAYWLPPRLWAYAAQNQPDGVFEGYSAGELAALLGYQGDATSMLQAMLQARFMDDSPLRIHGWDEHNGYHKSFADRAKKAAEVRWSKAQTKNPPPIPPTNVQDIDKTRRQALLVASPSIASSIEGRERENVGKDIPPSLISVIHQAAAIGLSEHEAEKFFNHYESNGWMVGKSRMKSWHCALAGWKLRSEEKTGGNNGNPHPPLASLKVIEQLIDKHPGNPSNIAYSMSTPQERAEFDALLVRQKELQTRIANGQ